MCGAEAEKGEEAVTCPGRRLSVCLSSCSFVSHSSYLAFAMLIQCAVFSFKVHDI